MHLSMILAIVHCFLLTRSSQGNKQYGLWEDSLEGFENISSVTCNASSSYLSSLVLFKIFNNSNLPLVFYKASQGGKECSPSNASQSCTYDDVTVTLRSQENFSEEETIEYRCDEYQIPHWNPGNPNILSHYLNVTRKEKNATLSKLYIDNGKSSDVTVIVILGVLIILLVICLFVSILIYKRKANRSKKRKQPVQHLKPIDQCADSTALDQLSLGHPCTPPPTDPPPVLPWKGHVMKYDKLVVNCYPDSDRPTPDASICYQEPWDNKKEIRIGVFDNIYSSAFMCRIPEPIPSQ